MDFGRVLRCALIGSIALGSTALSGCALPHYRGNKIFPRDIVFARIKCELYLAVIGAKTLQDGIYAKSKPKFQIENYFAELTLQERTQTSVAAVVGGSLDSAERIPGSRDTIRRFAGGAAGSPTGLGGSVTNFQYRNGKRAINFADILAEKGKPDNFFDRCSRMQTVAYGTDLGIGASLAQTLKELSVSPGFLTLEEYDFDFTVVVSAGGTISFIEPIRQLSLGATGSQTFNETLNVKISPVSRR